MPKKKVKKAICKKCGVDVRDNTAFCYNCGNPVTEITPDSQSALSGSEAEVDPETKSALDDLAERLSLDGSAENDKLAKAAAERKKARVSQRKSKEFVWEPTDDSSSRSVVLLSVLITAIAAGIVFLTVMWK